MVREVQVDNQWLPIARTPCRVCVTDPCVLFDVVVGVAPPQERLCAADKWVAYEDPSRLQVSVRSSAPTTIQFQEYETDRTIAIDEQWQREERQRQEDAARDAERIAREHVLARRKGQIANTLYRMELMKLGGEKKLRKAISEQPDAANFNIVETKQGWVLEGHPNRSLGFLPVDREPIFFAAQIKAIYGDAACDLDHICCWRGFRVRQIARMHVALRYAETPRPRDPWSGKRISSGIPMF